MLEGDEVLFQTDVLFHRESAMAETIRTFTRSGNKPRYRDIYAGLLQRVGLAFAEGTKYEKNLAAGYKNYHLATPMEGLDCFDHAMEHLLEYGAYLHDLLHGIPAAESVHGKEDHLGHAVANLSMLADFEDRGLFSPAVAVPSEDLTEHIDLKLEPLVDSIANPKLLGVVWPDLSVAPPKLDVKKTVGKIAAFFGAE